MSDKRVNKQGMSRRRFLQISALAGGATLLPLPVRWLGASKAHAFANSAQLSKWGVNQPLRGLYIPPTHPLNGLIPSDPAGIPVMAGTPDPVIANTRMYEVAAKEFSDLLHPNMGGATKLWGYHEVGAAVPQRHLGGLIIATRGTATRIRMTNSLPTQHIIPVDATLPGADVQNKIAVHLHGGEIPWISDGGPFDWWTPTGASGLSFQNGPNSATNPSVLDNIPTKPLQAGQADYFYPNNQSTRLMWYHDHAHGITRINAYAGVATGYLCVDLAQEQIVSAGTFARLTNPADLTQDNVPFIGSSIPVVFQDKVFVNPTTLAVDPTWAQAAPRSLSTGSLWYDHVYNPAAFKLKKGGGFLPPPVPTSCIPEFFGDTMLANGTVFPVVTVEAKPTRFLFLNACNARFLNLNLYNVKPGHEIWTDPRTGLPANQIPSTGAAALPLAPPTLPAAGPALWQIATEGGYLAAPAKSLNGAAGLFNPATLTGNLILGPAERADVVIDFTGFANQEYIFYSDTPGPFPVGPPANDYWWGNPKNPLAGPPGFGPDTRQILRIKVVAAGAGIPAKAPGATMLNGLFPLPTGQDPSFLVPYGVIPAVGPLPPLAPPAGAVPKNFTLNEDFDIYGRLRQLVGTTVPAIGKGGAAAFGLEYLVAPQPEDQHVQNGIEVWNIYNLSADTHPMHIHLVNAQILKRQPFKLVNGVFTLTGVARGPELNEVGWKETFKMHPGEVITICMKWTLPAVPFKVPSSNRATQALNLLAGQWGMGLAAGQVYNESVWHCHILEHEEHDMMRPLLVTGQNPQTPMVLNPANVGFNGFLGGTARIFINSGTGPYTAVSNSGAVSVTPGTFNQIAYVDVAVAANTGPGTATITVTDSSVPAQTATAAIDIFGVAPFTAVVSGLAGGVAGPFTIGGGTTPYTIVSSNPLYLPTPTPTGFAVNVTADPLWVPGTIVTVTYTISDASVPAQQATVTLTIN
jgi:FtsP/CotA-like multicopper oxidase with cupredoxin domain